MAEEVSWKNHFISVHEAEQILSAITPAEEHYRLLLLLVAHGCRPCEAVGLNFTDFTSQDCTQFYVNNTKVAYNGRPVRRDLKIVPRWLGQKIKEYITERCSWGGLPQGYLFPTDKPRKLKHMTAESVLTWFGKLRRRIGLTDVVGWKRNVLGTEMPIYRCSVYSFRRLYATELAVAGVDQRVIAALMGHKDTAITAQYQDRRRFFERAVLEVEKMPRFLTAGQLRLTSYPTAKP